MRPRQHVKAGRIVESGTLAELRHLSRTQVMAEIADPADLGDLAGVAGIHDLAVDGRRLTCQVDAASLPEVLRRLAAAGVRSLTSSPPTLEELFLRHYGDSDREAGAA